MNKKLVWATVAVVVALGAAWSAKGYFARKAGTGPVSAAAAAASSAQAQQAIELAAGDVVQAVRADLSNTLTITGSLKAVQSAVVKAKVAAELKSLTVREGDRVSAGQLIGQLDATEYQLRLRQAEDQAQAAQSQLDIAQKTLDNNKALVNQGFISRNALDNSVSSAAGAQASMQAARAAADIARKAVRDSEVRAPISGLVAARLVQPGERVGLDARIVEIVDLGRLELEAAVAPEDVVQLRVGQTARVTIDGLPEPVGARVARINPSAQTGTRAVLAYLELAPGASAAGLRQGLFARGTIELQRKSALVVPASALRYDQARPYLLAVVDGKAQSRAVSTGARGDVVIDGRSESAVEITGGLDAGATVLRGTVGALREGTRLMLPGAARAASAAPTASPAPAASR
jgi:membrane fusion protein, multidrug efflux system